MQLIDEVTRRALPPLYANEHQPGSPMVQAKFFTPWAGWTWYVLEYDGADVCYGYVVGHDAELGYFSIAELEATRGPGGLTVERDIHFQPRPLAEIQRILDNGGHP